ncbi:hypothetical protein ES707_13614 [subsurface metagenome]
MARWRPKEERLRLGKRIAYLRDVEGFNWREIIERLDINSASIARGYYKAYKATLLAGKGSGKIFK